MDWARILAYVTGTVDQELLARIEYCPPKIGFKREVEQLIVRMAKENHDWGYDRIVGALANLGYKVCDQTVGNVLQRHGLPPAPERKRTTTWWAFIRIHLALLAATDFFPAEVLTLRGLATLSLLKNQFGAIGGSDGRPRLPRPSYAARRS